MVDVGYRNRGLFTDMAQRSNEAMHQDGVQFVYGFPNGNSSISK